MNAKNVSAHSHYLSWLSGFRAKLVKFGQSKHPHCTFVLHLS